MTTTPPDVIDAIVGISPGDDLDAVRAGRPEARLHAQGSYLALFEPRDQNHMSLEERHAVAAFVAVLHAQPATADFYSSALTDAQGGSDRVAALVLDEARRASHPGPYGAFPGENADESTTGPGYSVASVESAYVLGDRLAAALEHAHMLTLHPRDADREAIQRLFDAGWSSTGVVTLSQLVAFLAFQIRVVQGLTALRGRAPAEGRPEGDIR